MSEITIISLWYRNFKALRDYTIVLNGDDADVFAENGLGKTTLEDGFQWLTSDKNAAHKKDFNIKTLKESGEAVSGYEHEVGAKLLVDGKEITLQKIYHEIYTKKRGSARETFTGHTSDYKIDDLKVSEKKFKERVSELCDETLLRLLTDLTYFNVVMKWEDRRRLLVEVCGDVTEADIIASSDELSALPEILKGRSVDDHKQWLADQRKKINEELKSIPTRIDETQRGLPEVSGDSVAVERDLNKIRTAVQERHQEKARLDSGGEVAEKKRQLAEAKTALSEIERKAREATDKLKQEAGKETAAIRTKIDELKRQARSKGDDIKSNEAAITRKEKEMDDLRTRFTKTDAETFEPGEDTNCPVCETAPEDQAVRASEKALAAFNSDKATRLEKINTDGKALKDEAGSLALDNDRLRKETTGIEAEIADLEEELAAEPEPKTTEAPLPEAHAETLDEITILESQIARLGEGNTDALETIAAEIREMQQQIRSGEETLAAFKQIVDGNKRIDELKDQEKKLATEYEENERQLFLCEAFTKAEASLLTDKINSRFKLTRFKLFDQQINEGIKPCCVATLDGVPYPDLNTGSQIHVGLDIIATLSEHYGIVCPIFVDHAESVTDPIKAPGQLIRLIASVPDKSMRIEIKQREAVNG